MNQSQDRTEAAHAHEEHEFRSAGEERELRAVSTLLRNLPDPEPPEALVERVMSEVRRRETGPRVLRVAFRRFEPLVATALAAGIGALVLTTAVQSGLFPPGEPNRVDLEPSAARMVASATTPGTARTHRPLDPHLVSIPGADAQSAGLLGVSPTTSLNHPFGTRESVTNPLDRRLDRQINSLLLDPGAFYQRIAQMDEPERFVARLADRAARRGDAAEVALRLRQRSPQHPQNGVMVDRLLRAALARRVPLR